MTINGIIFGICLSFIIVTSIFGIILYNEWFKKPYLICSILSIVILVILWSGMFYYYNNTAVGRRALKSQKSNFGKGIEREIKVYDINGKIIESYKGKFDIEYEDDKILFDDENNIRHIIYFKTGTVIVNEIEN